MSKSSSYENGDCGGSHGLNVPLVFVKCTDKEPRGALMPVWRRQAPATLSSYGDGDHGHHHKNAEETP